MAYAAKHTTIRAAALDPRPARSPAYKRSAVTAALFALAFAILAGRIMSLGLGPRQGGDETGRGDLSTALFRPEIVDRNGRVLATDILTGSLYANPEQITHLDDTIEQLLRLLPDLDAESLRGRLSGDGKFQWIARKLTPRQQQAIHELGLPGLYFTPEPQRVYPAGAVAAHILGQVDVDNKGLSGIETWIDRAPPVSRSDQTAVPERGAVRLAVDLSVQHALREELAGAIERYKAKAAAGLVLDVHSGEVMALVSLPDYDPNLRDGALGEDRFNRLTAGVFEMGSVFKVFTTAAALDLGVTSLRKGYDAREPIRVGGFTIRDFHAKRRWLSVPEIFIYSSNIGTTRMALDIGMDRHRAFLRRLGLLERLHTELGETAVPLVPNPWRRINTMTISYGHGLSVTPLQMAVAATALVNGGMLVEPTFLQRSRAEARVRAVRVIREETSDLMRYLLRLNVKRGSGKRADAEGYRVGGKTGTAEKVVKGRYSNDALLTSFLAAFPMDAPEYLVLVMLDEPQATEDTLGYATAGMNAAPVAKRVIERIGPMLAVTPKFDRKPAFDEAVSASY